MRISIDPSTKSLFSPPFAGTFLHAIDRKDWYSCANIANTKRIISAEFARFWEYLCTGKDGLRNSYREIDLDQLGANYGCAYPSPRTTNSIICASMIKSGLRVGIGVQNTVWLSQSGVDRRLRMAEVEAAFEKRRRLVAPSAASRLGCLWVAENSDSGAKMLNEMLPERFVLTVTIPSALRVTKVDSRWVDEYFRTNSIALIDAYWNEEKFSNVEESWEYLVEGQILAIDDEQVQYVHDHLCPSELLLN